MAGIRIKKKILIPVCAALMAALALVLWAGVTYGWFESKRETPGTVSFGSSDAYGTVSFRAGDGAAAHTLAHSDAYYNNNKYSFQAELVTKSASNYLGHMRLTVYFRGTEETCLRVRIVEEWKDALGRKKRMPLTTMAYDNTKWIDNRKEDNAFYYSDVGNAADGWRIKNANTTDVTELRLVTGDPVIYSPLAAGTVLTIGIVVETVQFNRYQEIWKLKEYPSR